MKEPTSTTLDTEWKERLEALAEEGFSTPASILRQLVIRFLPLMEQEMKQLKKRKK